MQVEGVSRPYLGENVNRLSLLPWTPMAILIGKSVPLYMYCTYTGEIIKPPKSGCPQDYGNPTLVGRKPDMQLKPVELVAGPKSRIMIINEIFTDIFTRWTI